MTQASAPLPQPDILAPLRAVAARRRLRTALRIGLAIGLAVLAALVLLRGLALLGVEVSNPALVVLLAAAAVAAGGGVAAWLGRRTPTEEAFFIDRNAGFAEAYGTAAELAAGQARLEGPVPAGLVASVRRRMSAISPRRLVPVATPGFLLALAAAAILAGSYVFLSSQPVPEPAEIGLEEPAAEAQVSAETLATVAERIAEDAAQRNDPLLGAISRALAERAQAAAAGPLPESLAEEVADLLDQAAAAYGEDLPPWLGSSEGLSLTEIEETLQAAAEAPSAPLPPLDPAQGRGDDVLQSESGPGLYEARPELAEQYAGRDSDEIIANAGEAEGAPSGSGSLDLGGGDSEGPRPIESQELVALGSIPVGAALQSGRGESDAAGLGQETLEADDAFLGLDAQPSEDVVVSAEPQAGGSRIRIEIVPETAEDAAQSGAGTAFGQSAGGSVEPVSRDFVPAAARALIARYFERLAQ